MYPNLYYFFKDVLGVEWEWARFLNSFGFFVALAFIFSAIVLTKGLQRKEKQGLLQPHEEKRVFGKPASVSEILINALLGFLMGYKIIGAFINASSKVNPQEYIFSSNGSWGAGILMALLFGGIKWYEKHTQKSTRVEERMIRIWPHERVGDLTVLAAIFGFAGAKIFHNLENWNEFIANPISALTSFSGLTFYGGLICAAIAIIIFAKRKGISIRHLADAMAPTLMLAYAIGRIGCQVAGDGDWGIPNAAYVADSAAVVRLANNGEFSQALKSNTMYLKQEFGRDVKPENVPYANFKAPSFIPTWMVAYTYPNNVNGIGNKIANCNDVDFCTYLPLPVFPTPFYETMACLVLFGLLLFYRSRIKLAGGLFCVYLVFNGIERFIIEKIRVNTKYQDLIFQPTQAELISFSLIILGIFLYVVCKKKATT